MPLVAACFAVAGPATRVAVTSVDAFSVVAARCGIAGMALLAMTGLKAWPRARADRARVVGAGAVFALHLTCFVAGIRLAHFVSAMTLIALEPLSVVGIGAFFFDDKPTRGQLVGVLVAVLGAVLIARQPSAAATPSSWLGDALVLLAVMLYGVYYGLNRSLKRHVTASGGSFGLATVVYLIATVVALAVRLVVPLAWRIPMAWPSPGVIVALVVLGIVPTLVGHTGYQIASRELSPSWMAMIAPGESIGAIAIGWFLFEASPTPFELAGGALVLFGAWLAGRNA